MGCTGSKEKTVREEEPLLASPAKTVRPEDRPPSPTPNLLDPASPPLPGLEGTTLNKFESGRNISENIFHDPGPSPSAPPSSTSGPRVSTPPFSQPDPGLAQPDLSNSTEIPKSSPVSPRRTPKLNLEGAEECTKCYLITVAEAPFLFAKLDQLLRIDIYS